MEKLFFIPPFLGYLLGSLSPSYFIGRILAGIHLREVGDKNLGAVNTKKVLGFWAAVPVAIFDLSKGVLAILILRWLGLPLFWCYLGGIFAIVGHIFPFYLKFKGGQGVGVAVGLIFYFSALLIKDNLFYNPKTALFSIIVLAFLSLGLYFISKIGEVIGIFVLPSFIALLFLNHPLNLISGFLTAVLLFILSIQIINIKNRKILALGEEKEHILHWRSLLRPLAALFPILAFFLSKKALLILVGPLAGIFIVLDLVRLIISKVNFFLFNKLKGFLKEKEEGKFSSMTFFLSAVFIIYLVFPHNIAGPVVLFLVFGDLAAKYFGVKYGRRKFFTKTLEGFIAYFIFSLLAGFIFSFFAPLPFWILLLGALAASVTETLSIFGIDDNFTVGLISAAIIFGLTQVV